MRLKAAIVGKGKTCAPDQCTILMLGRVPGGLRDLRLVIRSLLLADDTGHRSETLRIDELGRGHLKKRGYEELVPLVRSDETQVFGDAGVTWHPDTRK